MTTQQMQQEAYIDTALCCATALGLNVGGALLAVGSPLVATLAFAASAAIGMVTRKRQM